MKPLRLAVVESSATSEVIEVPDDLLAALLRAAVPFDGNWRGGSLNPPKESR